MLVSKQDMDEYFSGHLLSEKYFSSDASVISGALAMAENDVASQLDLFPPENTALFTAAVGEQLIALLSDPGSASAFRQVASESVEGLGSRSYVCGKDPAGKVLAPRAEMYIRKLNEMNKKLNLVRG